MIDVKKIEINADDYPNSNHRAIPLNTGDSFYITNNHPVKIGDYYGNNPMLFVSEIYYAARKWYKFWKKKEQIGYKVTHR